MAENSKFWNVTTIGVIVAIIGVIVAIWAGLPGWIVYLTTSNTNQNIRIITNNNANATNANIVNANALTPPGIKSPIELVTPTLSPEEIRESELKPTPKDSPPRATPTQTITPLPPKPTPSDTSSRKVEPPVIENVIFNLLGCGFANGNVTCRFRITNSGLDRKVGFRYPQSMSDDLGKEYFCKYPQIMDSRKDVRLLTDTPVDATITFEGVNQNISFIKRLGVRFAVEGTRGHLRFELSNINLTR